MNAILLALACGGAVAVFLATDPQEIAAAKGEVEIGSMTHDETVNPKTGETEETNVIAFLDEQ
jgi:hypothetical protein